MLHWQETQQTLKVQTNAAQYWLSEFLLYRADYVNSGCRCTLGAWSVCTKASASPVSTRLQVDAGCHNNAVIASVADTGTILEPITMPLYLVLLIPS